jgi:hypothetical protein
MGSCVVLAGATISSGQVIVQTPVFPPPETVAVPVAELLLGNGSFVVALAMLTVLVINVPAGVPAFTV